MHYFDTLKKKDKSINALKVVQRMAKLCCIGADECTALVVQVLCKWSEEGFSDLVKVLDRFEMYGTLEL